MLGLIVDTIRARSCHTRGPDRTLAVCCGRSYMSHTVVWKLVGRARGLYVVRTHILMRSGAQKEVAQGRGGGEGGMTQWCVLVCSWRRQWADRHLLPFPWTLSLHIHRRWCRTAFHHPPVSFLSLLGLSFPFHFPFLSLGTAQRGGGGAGAPGSIPQCRMASASGSLAAFCSTSWAARSFFVGLRPQLATGPRKVSPRASLIQKPMVRPSSASCLGSASFSRNSCSPLQGTCRWARVRRVPGAYAYAYTCPCARANAGPPSQILSLRVYNMATVSTIIRPRLQTMHSVHRLSSSE